MQNTKTEQVAFWVNEEGELVNVKVEEIESREIPKGTTCADVNDVLYFESLCQ